MKKRMNFYHELKFYASCLAGPARHATSNIFNMLPISRLAQSQLININSKKTTAVISTSCYDKTHKSSNHINKNSAKSETRKSPKNFALQKILPSAQNKIGQNPGVSLLIAVVYVSAFMLVMAGLYTATLQVIKGIANRETEAKTEYLAQSAFELASYWAANHSEGHNFADFGGDTAKFFAPLYAAAADLGIPDCEAKKCIGFDVVGRADENDVAKKVNGLNSSWFSVPVRGTGNAEEKCIDETSADDGCNWNKLYVGQSADIPLYYIDGGGVTRVLTGDFKLRVRTPTCDKFAFKGADCDIAGRIILYPQIADPRKTNYPFRNIDKDPILIQWTMSDTKNNISIIAWDRVNALQNSNLRDIVNNNSNQNTELSSGRINDANPSTPYWFLTDFVVLGRLNPTMSGKDISKAAVTIDSFLTTASNNNGKPVLHLNMVDQPRVDDDGDASTTLSNNSLNDPKYNVPYLEYQLLTPQMPVTDTKRYLYAWVEFLGFRKEIKKEDSKSSSLGGFALENF